MKMNYTLAGTAIIILLAAAVGGGLDYLGSSGLYHSSSIPTVPSTEALVVMVSGAYYNESLGFSPLNVTVMLGVNSTVVFFNNDAAVHTATANDGSWNTGDVLPGQAAMIKFNTTGTFAYHCTYHPYMVGTITVVASS